MNFLKISGLVIGTGSVIGGAGAGIYYGLSKDSDAVIENNNEIHQNPEINGKVDFIGKLVFEKKAGSHDNYEIKFLTNDEYNTAVTSFDEGKSDEDEKYAAVNKILDIAYLLNPETAKTELTNIFNSETTLANAKTKVTSEEEKLKELFGDTIYSSLNTLIS